MAPGFTKWQETKIRQATVDRTGELSKLIEKQKQVMQQFKDIEEKYFKCKIKTILNEGYNYERMRQ